MSSRKLTQILSEGDEMQLSVQTLNGKTQLTLSIIDAEFSRKRQRDDDAVLEVQPPHPFSSFAFQKQKYEAKPEEEAKQKKEPKAKKEAKQDEPKGGKP